MASESGAQPTVNETASCGALTLEEVTRELNEIKKQNAREFQEVKGLMSNTFNVAEPSKQAIVSALTCEYLGLCDYVSFSPTI